MNSLYGWREVEAFAGMKEHRIRRAIGHFGFPKPTKKVVQTKGSNIQAITNVWDKGAVLTWINLNKGKLDERLNIG